MEIVLDGISKVYPLKKALDHVSVKISSGTIHALFGENGAGKTTLAQIVSGNIRQSSGKIFLDGKETSFSSAKDAIKKGIVIVQQTPLLSQSLTAFENLVLKTELAPGKKQSLLVDYSVPKELEKLKNKWCPSLNFSSKVKDLGANLRFYVSLLGALCLDPKCLILDEPSAFLDSDERKKLYASLKEIASSEKTVIVITHSAWEAETYADQITFLKKGKCVSKEEFKKLLPHNDFLSEVIQNQSLEKSDASVSLSYENISCRPKNRPALLEASLLVRAGEISAVTGLKQSAIETLEDLVTGMEKEAASGKVSFTDSKGMHYDFSLSEKKLSSAFLRNHGVAIVPSDRNYRGSNPSLTVSQMLCAHYRGKNVKEKAAEMISLAKVNINPEEKCSSLSGGMLQRLILVRELSLSPSLVILCNPMQGLDIQSQAYYTKTITNLSKEGKAVLIIGASDFPLSLCSRVYEMEGGICALSFGKETV